MSRFHYRHWLSPTCGVLLFVLAGCSSRYTGPWNLDELRKPPQAKWIDTSGPVRALYDAGETYDGQPTCVFAYYAVPEDTGQRVPAMVLVHGGGGTAFREWVEIWAERGYAAIATWWGQGSGRFCYSYVLNGSPVFGYPNAGAVENSLHYMRITVTPNAVEPNSLGRVKGVFK